MRLGVLCLSERAAETAGGKPSLHTSRGYVTPGSAQEISRKRLSPLLTVQHGNKINRPGSCWPPPGGASNPTSLSSTSSWELGIATPSGCNVGTKRGGQSGEKAVKRKSCERENGSKCR